VTNPFSLIGSFIEALFAKPNLMDIDTLNGFWNGKRGADSPVRLMGFRGGLEPAGSPNATGTYDDLIAVIIDGQVSFWRASVDPSTALIRQPINSDGAAQLCEGIHLFGRVKMHGKYPCFGQAEAVHVNRLDARGNVQCVQFGWYGIDIHSGGGGDDTQRFSAGCQIVGNRDGYFGDPTWSRFYGPIDAALARHGITTFPYMLLSQTNLSAPQHLENA